MSYQKCPVCEGLGTFLDLTQPITNFSNPVECPTCKGTRIISTLTGEPPLKQKNTKSQNQKDFEKMLKSKL